MQTCPKCGAAVEDGINFCPACGEAVAAAGAQAGEPQQSKFQDTVNNLGNTPDYTLDFDPADVNQNKGLACLSYVSILVLIPLFVAKDSAYAKFHVNQGLPLAIAGVAMGILQKILWFIPVIRWISGSLIGLLGLAIFVLSVIGLINALTGKAKELPLTGKIKILK